MHQTYISHLSPYIQRCAYSVNQRPSTDLSCPSLPLILRCLHRQSPSLFQIISAFSSAMTISLMSPCCHSPLFLIKHFKCQLSTFSLNMTQCPGDHFPHIYRNSKAETLCCRTFWLGFFQFQSSTSSSLVAQSVYIVI